ncbi:hypothetical protein CHUAL_000202 [Chamberlinius hualienensis]
MKTLACLIALFLSVSAQLTYENVNNQCSAITPSGNIQQIIGPTWKVLTWTEPAVRCGTFKATKDPSGNTYTGKFTYYASDDLTFRKKIVLVNSYVSDLGELGYLERANDTTSDPFRINVIMFAKLNVGFSAIGCDLKNGSSKNYAAGYYGLDADQATKDKLKADLASQSGLTLNDVYQGSDCPAA